VRAVHAFGKLSQIAHPDAPKAEHALKKIFVLLRAQTGHDFSQYKPSAINRRIERRLAVHQIDGIASYVKYLQQTPTEVEALFRDPDIFKELEEQIIPKLFDSKAPGSRARVRSTGCSTGEEAYSIAILLQEYMDGHQQSYPAGIAADISPQRLARFFTPEPDGIGYRVVKGIRDMLAFSEQDVLKDPPFSRLDLLSCRNLLIYMDADLQKRLIPLFHYALNPGGMLFLGSSEGIGDFHELFTVLDRKAKLYQRKPDVHGLARASPIRFSHPDH
jgi:two-component system CheB/CheR fusion protein